MQADVTAWHFARSGLSARLEEPRVADLEFLAKRGWRLLPCKRRSKTPLVRWNAQATSDVTKICTWAEEYQGCNWAVVCGHESGVWVLDVDGAEGASTIDTFCQRHGCDWLSTLTAITTHGHHYYFAYPAQFTVKTSVRQLGPGLDTRGSGGYVIIPPSIHPSGEQYRWLDSSVPIASAPDWLLQMVVTSAPKRVAGNSRQYADLFEGQRNDGLARFGGSLRRKGKSFEEIEAELQEANVRRCKPPLSTMEVRKIAASVAQYPVGGPDPLEAAWEIVQQGDYGSRYLTFVELARQLQLARPGQTIALPVVRVGGLLECEPSLVSRYRHRAEDEGFLTVIEKHIPHRKGTLFHFNFDVQLGRVQLDHTISGLVEHPLSVPPSSTRSLPSCTPDQPRKSQVLQRDPVMIEGRI